MSHADRMQQRAPDFFLVGAPKCATSSLHLLLIRHPDIFMCSPKEPHFFSTDMPGLREVSDRASYDALFAAAPPSAKWGEASAFYLSSRTAAAEIYKANPDARIILSIRNPADAVVSLHQQLRDGFREDQESFEAAWALQEARAHGEKLPSYCPEPGQLQYRNVYSYHEQIRRYFDVFGRDAVKILMFDDISKNSAAVISEVLDFIGVAPFETTVEMPQTNRRRAPRFPGLVQFVTSPPTPLRPLVGPLKRGLNRLGIKPSEVVMKHLSKPAKKSSNTIDPAFRREVVEAFRADVEKLETLLEVDLSAWKA